MRKIVTWILFGIVLASCTTLHDTPPLGKFCLTDETLAVFSLSRKWGDFHKGYRKFDDFGLLSTYRNLSPEKLTKRLNNGYYGAANYEELYIRYIMDLNPVNADVIRNRLQVYPYDGALAFSVTTKWYHDIYSKQAGDWSTKYDLFDAVAYQLLDAKSQDDIDNILDTMDYLNSDPLVFIHPSVGYLDYKHNRDYPTTLLLTFLRTKFDLSVNQDGSDPLYGKEFPMELIIQYDRAIQSGTDDFDRTPLDNETTFYNLYRFNESSNNNVVRIEGRSYNADALFYYAINTINLLRLKTFPEGTYYSSLESYNLAVESYFSAIKNKQRIIAEEKATLARLERMDTGSSSAFWGSFNQGMNDYVESSKEQQEAFDRIDSETMNSTYMDSSSTSTTSSSNKASGSNTPTAAPSACNTVRSDKKPSTSRDSSPMRLYSALDEYKTDFHDFNFYFNAGYYEKNRWSEWCVLCNDNNISISARIIYRSTGYTGIQVKVKNKLNSLIQFSIKDPSFYTFEEGSSEGHIVEESSELMFLKAGDTQENTPWSIKGEVDLFSIAGYVMEVRE